MVLGGLVTLSRPAPAQFERRVIVMPAPEGDGVVVGTSTIPTLAFVQKGIELDRAVARVERTVLTLTELLAEARLTLLREGRPYAAERLALEPKELEAVLQAIGQDTTNQDAERLGAFLSSVLAQMVQRTLLLTEVRRLQLREIPEEEVVEAYEALLRVIPDRVRLREALAAAGFGVSDDPMGRGPPPALAAVLRAELSAERLVELRARTLPPISEEELQACYATLEKQLGSPGLERVRRALEHAMRLDRLTARIAELITQLEARVEVRYAPPFRRAAPPPVERCPSLEAP